jgi:hypothetical protein
MMVQKLETRVRKFNFDLILEKALALLGLQFPAYDFAAAHTKKIYAHFLAIPFKNRQQ